MVLVQPFGRGVGARPQPSERRTMCWNDGKMSAIYACFQAPGIGEGIGMLLEFEAASEGRNEGRLSSDTLPAGGSRASLDRLRCLHTSCATPAPIVKLNT